MSDGKWGNWIKYNGTLVLDGEPDIVITQQNGAFLLEIEGVRTRYDSLTTASIRGEIYANERKAFV